jgi:hypothetical protein
LTDDECRETSSSNGLIKLGDGDAAGGFIGGIVAICSGTTHALP